MNSDNSTPRAAPPPYGEIPEPQREAPRRWPSLIWLVPLLAVAVGIGLAVHAITQQGPEITLQFAQADGLEAKKTRIKYKNVDVGTVTAISLSKDRASVRITARMDKDAGSLLAEDSRFWVVRPRFGLSGISGLTTLVSGAYIAVDPGHSENSSRSFIGLETPPLVTSDAPGRQFLLKAEDLGSLDIGTPVYYRRIAVGRVVGYDLSLDGQGVDVRIFVDAPFDRFVTYRSRFWQTSGISVSMNAEGMKFDMQSVASLVAGGIAFSSPPTQGNDPVDSAPAEASFALYADSASAHRVPDTVTRNFLLVFRESVRGLSVGAPVDFRGLMIGEVTRIGIAPESQGKDMPITVEVNIYPERLSQRMGKLAHDAANTTDTTQMHKEFDAMVANGLRAQMRTGNLLSGQRYVALDFFAKAAPKKMLWNKPVPELPTQPTMAVSLEDQLLEVAAQLQQTLARVDRLAARVEKGTMPEVDATLKNARGTLEQVNRVLSSDAPLQREVRDALREVGRAASSVRNLADLLERQPEALITGKKEGDR